MDEQPWLLNLPEKMALAPCLLIIWLLLIVRAGFAGLLSDKINPLDEFSFAGSIAFTGVIVYSIADRRRWARWALVALVVGGLLYSLHTGEPQLSEPLEGSAFVARVLIVTLPAAALCLLLTKKACRWFRR